MDENGKPEKSIKKALSPKMKRKRRSKIIIVAVFVCALFVCAAAVYFFPEIIGIESNNLRTVTVETYKAGEFSEPDYSLDVYSDSEYAQLDSYLRYYHDGITEYIDKSTADGYDERVKFFYAYFETLKAGDEKTYDTYFTDNYFKSSYYKNYSYDKVSPSGMMAPQMVYDITVSFIKEDTASDESTEYLYSVSYEIHENNGTFRRDIPSDASRLQYYVLKDTASGVKIDSISFVV